jgi:Beta/Gamma crystallin
VTFVGFGTLAAILIGSDYYDPYGYVPIARPWCSGLTENGCTLHWQTVALEEGGEQVQCVQYCRRRIASSAPATAPATEVAPAAAVALASEPPQPRGQCELVVYADPGLQGQEGPTSEDHPLLSDIGWKNEIGSIEVKAGTWDFFTDDNYAGATMRLAPGVYRVLGADWTKKISSFNCTNPA